MILNLAENKSNIRDGAFLNRLGNKAYLVEIEILGGAKRKVETREFVERRGDLGAADGIDAALANGNECDSYSGAYEVRQ
jgi:hypothetical protein